MSVAIAVPLLSSTAFIDMRYRLSSLKRLLDYLKPCIESVVERPEEVESVAMRIVEDQRALILFVAATIEVLRLPRSEMVRAFEELRKFVEDLRARGIDVREAIEILLEHDLWKLRWLATDFDRYIGMWFEFVSRYEDEARRYVLLYLSCFLLMLALYEVSDEKKLRRIAEIVKKYADELESYLATFVLAMESPQPEDLEVVGKARTPDELRKVLDLE